MSLFVHRFGIYFYCILLFVAQGLANGEGLPPQAVLPSIHAYPGIGESIGKYLYPKQILFFRVKLKCPFLV